MWHMNIILLRGGGVSDLIFPNFVRYLVTLDKECIIILSQHMWCIMLPQDFQILIDVIPVLLRKRMISEQKQHQNPTLPCIDQKQLKAYRPGWRRESSPAELSKLQLVSKKLALTGNKTLFRPKCQKLIITPVFRVHRCEPNTLIFKWHISGNWSRIFQCCS